MVEFYHIDEDFYYTKSDEKGLSIISRSVLCFFPPFKMTLDKAKAGNKFAAMVKWHINMLPARCFSFYYRMNNSLALREYLEFYDPSLEITTRLFEKFPNPHRMQ